MVNARGILFSSLLAATLAAGCVVPSGGGGPYRDDPYGGGYGYPNDDYDDRVIYQQEHRRVSCGEIEQRIRYDRDKISEIPPGRHQKARQWYVDDIQNAERDLSECRAERREEWRDRQHDRQYDRDLERQREREREAERQRAWQQSRAQCDKLHERIRFDRQKMDEIRPGEHNKARQWYIDDIHNAERDLQNSGCRR